MPAPSSDSSAISTGAIPARLGSVITKALRTPRSARSIPTSRVTPGPKRTLDAAISKANSFFIPRGDVTANGQLNAGQAGAVPLDGIGHLQNVIDWFGGFEHERREGWANLQQRDELVGGKGILLFPIKRHHPNDASRVYQRQCQCGRKNRRCAAVAGISRLNRGIAIQDGLAHVGYPADQTFAQWNPQTG